MIGIGYKLGMNRSGRPIIRYALPRHARSAVIVGYIAIVWEALQLLSVSIPGSNQPIHSTFYVVPGVIVWMILRSLCRRGIHSFADSKQRSLIRNRDLLSHDQFRALLGDTGSKGDVVERWVRYYEKLAVNPLQLRPDDTVSQIGLRWFTYHSGDDHVDRTVVYFWRSDLTLGELFRIAESARGGGKSMVPGWRVIGRLGTDLSTLVFVMCLWESINPIVHVQQLSWKTTSAQLTGLNFTEYHDPGTMSLRTKGKRAEIRYIPSCSYAFEYKGKTYVGNSFAQWSPQLTLAQMQQVVGSFYNGERDVDVIFSRWFPQMNAAVYSGVNLRHSSGRVVFAGVFIACGVCLVLFAVSSVRQHWGRKVELGGDRVKDVRFGEMEMASSNQAKS